MPAVEWAFRVLSHTPHLCTFQSTNSTSADQALPCRQTCLILSLYLESFSFALLLWISIISKEFGHIDEFTCEYYSWGTGGSPSLMLNSCVSLPSALLPARHHCSPGDQSVGFSTPKYTGIVDPSATVLINGNPRCSMADSFGIPPSSTPTDQMSGLPLVLGTTTVHACLYVFVHLLEHLANFTLCHTLRPAYSRSQYMMYKKSMETQGWSRELSLNTRGLNKQTRRISANAEGM